MLHAAAVVTAVYGGLVLLGGLMGWLKARSKPSLIMGGIFGIVLLAIGLGGVWGTFQPWVAVGLAAFLLVFFGIRYLRKKKFMPAGMLAIMSLVVLAIDLTAAAGP